MMHTEIGDINCFDSFGKSNSFIGLCPSEYSSGWRFHKGKITNRAHKIIILLIIKAAWVSLRVDPVLTL